MLQHPPNLLHHHAPAPSQHGEAAEPPLSVESRPRAQQEMDRRAPREKQPAALALDGTWDDEKTEAQAAYEKLGEEAESEETQSEREITQPMRTTETPLRRISLRLRTLGKISRHSEALASVKPALALDTGMDETTSKDRPEELDIQPLQHNQREASGIRRKAKRRLQHGSSHQSFEQTNSNALILYNWYMLKTDKAQTVHSISAGMRGSAEDFNLLKLLAGTHEDRRGWSMLIDDLACPQCVKHLREQKADAEVCISAQGDTKLTVLSSLFQRQAGRETWRNAPGASIVTEAAAE